jgi:hypothetical protein
MDIMCMVIMFGGVGSAIFTAIISGQNLKSFAYMSSVQNKYEGKYVKDGQWYDIPIAPSIFSKCGKYVKKIISR